MQTHLSSFAKDSLHLTESIAEGLRKACFAGLVMWIAGMTWPLAAAEVPALRGLSRTDLLEVRSTNGAIIRATTPQEWEARRKEAVQGFLAVAGPLPGPEKRCPLAVKVLEEVDCGRYLRRLIEYQSEPQNWVPAYLCIPKEVLEPGAKPVAAVLCLHPTDNVVGHKVVVGLGGKPNRQYAVELAERGFVTLSPSYPLLAQYQPDLKALGQPSGTIKAVWDNMRGLDLLESLTFVKASAGFGVIGHSLGGHNSVFTAVLDPRIRVVVSSCGLDSMLDYKDGNLSGWVQERYMLKMADYLGRNAELPFDFYELVAVLAPRRVLISAPLHDSNFKHDSVARIAKAARPVFAFYGASARLEVMHPDCDHDFPDSARQRAYAILEEELR